jgi:hypothetical protein
MPVIAMNRTIGFNKRQQEIIKKAEFTAITEQFYADTPQPENYTRSNPGIDYAKIFYSF